MAVAPLDEGFDPAMTTRERVAFQTKETSCQSCHGLINPLGFGLEHYDAVGRFRAEEKDRPIDATGEYPAESGEAVRFDDARALAESLAASGEVHRSFVEQLFHYLVKQPTAAYGADELERLTAEFARQGCNIRTLMVEIMKSTALH